MAVVHGPAELIVEQAGDKERLYGGDDVGSWLNKVLSHVEALHSGRGAKPDSLVDLREGVVRSEGFLLVPRHPLAARNRRDRAACLHRGRRRRRPRTPGRRDGNPPPGQGGEPHAYRPARGRRGRHRGGAELPAPPGHGPGRTVPAGHRSPPPRPRWCGASVALEASTDLGWPICRACGLPIVAGAPRAEGPRPPLGTLTWDNGQVNHMPGAVLVGRDVAYDGAVVTGELTPLVPSGANDSMSRVHAELRPSGWDVVILDRGSTNGTFVWDEASKAWQRLSPGEAHVLQAGAVLAFGERTATFEPTEADTA